MADNFVTNPAAGGDTFAADDIAGVKWQRVKIGHGADGSATDVSSASPLPVDTELPAAAALADGASNPTTPLLGSVPLLWNNATLDRQRGNTEGTLLASAARTASVGSAAQTNHNARGVRITVCVTAKAAATNLALYLSEPKAWGNAYIMAIPVWTAGASKALICDIYPGVTPAAMAAGIAGGVDKYNAVSLPLGRTWVLEVFPSDANSVTYSVDYAYIL